MLVLGCTNDKQFQLRKIFSFCELTISSILFSKYISFHLQHIWKGKRMKEIKHSLFNGDPFSILESCCMDKRNKHTGAHVIKLKNIQTSQYIYIYIYMTTHQFQVRSTTIYLIAHQAKTQLNQIINYTKAGMFISLNVRSTNSLNNY